MSDAEFDEPLPKWLIYGVMVPLAPLIGVIVLRLLNEDKITLSLCWCSELPTFALQLSLIMLIQTFGDLNKIHGKKQRVVWWCQAGSIITAIPGILYFVMFCFDGTSHKLAEHLKTNLCWFLIVDIVAVVLFWLSFPWIRRKIDTSTHI